MVNQNPNNMELEKYSLREAFFSSLVVGLAETYFIAFSLHMGASVIESGLLSSLPLVVAGFSPLIFRSLFRKALNSTWVMISNIIQAVTIALLALIGALESRTAAGLGLDWLHQNIFWVLMMIYSIYWFSHFSSLPSWNKWISEILPYHRSDKYFSARSRRTQWGTIIGLAFGGFSLHLKVLDFSTSALFVILFLVAYHFKVVAFYLNYKLPISHTKYELSWTRAFNFFNRHKGFFLVYSLFNLSLYLSSPYVSGYLLKIRGLTYQDYMFVMAAFFSGKILTTMFLDRIKKDVTPHQMYFWGGLMAAPLPALWPFCEGVWALCLLHFFSGWGWAAWEVGMSLTIFKKIIPHEKIEAVTMYNMIGLPTQVLGTLLGAFLFKNLFLENYATMFIWAGIIRFIFMIPLYFQKFGHH